VVIHSLVGLLIKIVSDIYLNIGLEWVHLTCNHAFKNKTSECYSIPSDSDKLRWLQNFKMFNKVTVQAIILIYIYSV